MTAARASAEAISALLSGLANAVTDAQETMAELSAFDAYGRPMPVYQIPSLEFTFEIEALMDPATSSAPAMIRFAPVASNAPRGSVQSRISGRLVAVPPNSGLPEARILVSFGNGSLTLQLINSLDERLVGETLEIEFDAAASEALHGTALSPADRLRLLGQQRVTTDASGTARASVDTRVLPTGKSAVLLVRGAGSEARIAVSGSGS